MSMNDIQVDQAKLSKETVDNQSDTKEEISPDGIDVLNLPPRSAVHRKHGKTRIKLDKPLLRFLSVVIILLIIIGVSLIIN